MKRNAKRQRGISVNPDISADANGRVRGAGRLAAMLAEVVSDADLKAVARMVVAMAVAGDPTACRLLMDRLWPVPKGRLIEFPLPPVNDGDGVVAAHGALVQAVANGDLTIEEASGLSQLLCSQLKLNEAILIEKRVRALEETLRNPPDQTDWE